MATESPANGVSTTLSAAITSTATALSLTSATGFPNGQYTCLLSDGTNAELVEASALSGTTLTVARASEAWGGSATAYAFGIGTKVTIVTSVQSVIRLIQSYAAPAATVTGPDAYGAAAVVGVGTTFARADHDHGLPAAPAVSLYNYTDSAVVGAPVSGTNVTLTTPTLAVGTYLLQLEIAANTTAALTSEFVCGFHPSLGGTAVFTFLPDRIIDATSLPNGAPSSSYSTSSVQFVLTVTTAGTIILGAYNPTFTPANALGLIVSYVLVKIA